MAADTLDVLTFAEARTALNYGATYTDADLEQAITAVSRRIDLVFGAMVRRSVSESVQARGYSRLVALGSRPVVADSLDACLVTVSGGSLFTEGTEEERDVFPEVDLDRGDLSAGAGEWPRGRIDVTYQAGRYATTAAVDALVKQAAVLMLRNLWDSAVFDTVNDGGYDSPGVSFPTVGIPAAVWDSEKGTGLLAEFVRLPAVA